MLTWAQVLSDRFLIWAAQRKVNPTTIVTAADVDYFIEQLGQLKIEVLNEEVKQPDGAKIHR